MRELSLDKAHDAELTIQMLPKAVEFACHREVVVTSDIKLRELEKTSELLTSEPHNYKYHITAPSVVKSDSIQRLQFEKGSITPVTVFRGDLYDVCRKYNHAIVICDINSIVPGGGFRVGDDSNESQLCRYSTLYYELNSKSTKMRFYYSNSGNGRWAQDSVVLLPEVLFFSESQVEPLTEHVILGFSPPNMTVTSTQLKSSVKTRDCFIKRVQSAFDLALRLAMPKLNTETIIVPVFGYKTFNLPARLCATVLVDELNRIMTQSAASIVLVVDEETEGIADAIIPRLANTIYR